MNWKDLQYEKKYDGMTAYGQSKLANIMFALELLKKLKEHKSTVLSLLCSPGYTKTGIQKSQSLLVKIMTFFIAQNVDMGMLSSLRAAVDSYVKGGEFYGPLKMKEMRGYPELTPIPQQALDTEEREKLWRLSEEMTQTYFSFNKTI